MTSDKTFYSDIYHELLTLQEMSARMHTYLPRSHREDIQKLQSAMNQIELAALTLDMLLKENCNAEP